MLLHTAVRHFKDHGVEGLHGIVMTSRTRMVEKYERAGFTVLARCPSPRLSPRGHGKAYWLLIAMKLDTIDTQPFTSQAIRKRSRTSPLA